MRAADRLLDCVFGQPRQATELVADVRQELTPEQARRELESLMDELAGRRRRREETTRPEPSPGEDDVGYGTADPQPEPATTDEQRRVERELRD